MIFETLTQALAATHSTPNMENLFPGPIDNVNAMFVSYGQPLAANGELFWTTPKQMLIELLDSRQFAGHGLLPNETVEKPPFRSMPDSM